MEELQALDAELNELQLRINSVGLEVNRLSTELEDLRKTRSEHQGKLAAFEATQAYFGEATSREGLRELEKTYQDQIDRLLERRDESRKSRDQAKRAWRKSQSQLVAFYEDAQEEFVIQFHDLAHDFLGLSIDVEIETSSSGVGLLLSVAGRARWLEHQLSESQRFFIDIALRMALVNYMAEGATMFIDTPEGSLDSAYEARAGTMFSRFVQSGHHIIMTANINTSQLLLRLAETCGSGSMNLVRMTDWAALSDVQLAEQRLFDDALAAIEGRLRES